MNMLKNSPTKNYSTLILCTIVDSKCPENHEVQTVALLNFKIVQLTSIKDKKIGLVKFP